MTDRLVSGNLLDEMTDHRNRLLDDVCRLESALDTIRLQNLFQSIAFASCYTKGS